MYMCSVQCMYMYMAGSLSKQNLDKNPSRVETWPLPLILHCCKTTWMKMCYRFIITSEWQYHLFCLPISFVPSHTLFFGKLTGSFESCFIISKLHLSLFTCTSICFVGCILGKTFASLQWEWIGACEGRDKFYVWLKSSCVFNLQPKLCNPKEANKIQ